MTYLTRAWYDMATQWLGLMNPNGSCTKDKERRDLVKCWYMFDHKLLKCECSKYTCDVKVLQYSLNFSLQQVCTIWILFTYALLFTHVYCIMYVHSPSWRRYIDKSKLSINPEWSSWSQDHVPVFSTRITQTTTGRL